MACQGTDTVAALWLLAQYYSEACAGHSIPAMEHSTVTAWGRQGEVDAYRNALTAFPTGRPTGILDR